MGALLSGRRSGSCAAVQWDDTLRQYRCGAIVSTQAVLLNALPQVARGLAPLLAPLLRRLGLRWISAGTGCDSYLEVMRSAGSTTIADSDTTVVSRADPIRHD
jgi:hypothetical protein